MIIYLDESGDLGFNYSLQNTSRYLIIGLLVFPNGSSSIAHSAMVQAIKRTLKNKLPKNTAEIKGSKLALPIKQYFLKEANKQTDWCLYAAIADKRSWSQHHPTLAKKDLYNEVARRIFSQVSQLANCSVIDLIVDCSKNSKEIVAFDQLMKEALPKAIPQNVRFSIKHRRSQDDGGLQAIDVFCSGINRKYEQGDVTWYQEFSDKIAVEVEYKF